MSAGSSSGLLSLACAVQNESSVNINSLLTIYSFAEAADELKLRGEIALWRQRWIRLKMAFDDVVPETAASAFEACDHMTLPLIHAFLSILVTLPVSKASEVKQSIAVSRSDSLLHRPCP